MDGLKRAVLIVIFFVLIRSDMLLAQKFENDTIKITNKISSGETIEIVARRFLVNKDKVLYSIYRGDYDLNSTTASSFTPQYILCSFIVKVNGNPINLPRSLYISLYDPYEVMFKAGKKESFQIIFKCSDLDEAYTACYYFKNGVLIKSTITPPGCTPTRITTYYSCGQG